MCDPRVSCTLQSPDPVPARSWSIPHPPLNRTLSPPIAKTAERGTAAPEVGMPGKKYPILSFCHGLKLREIGGSLCVLGALCGQLQRLTCYWGDSVLANKNAGTQRERLALCAWRFAVSDRCPAAARCSLSLCCATLLPCPDASAPPRLRASAVCTPSPLRLCRPSPLRLCASAGLVLPSPPRVSPSPRQFFHGLRDGSTSSAVSSGYIGRESTSAAAASVCGRCTPPHPCRTNTGCLCTGTG